MENNNYMDPTFIKSNTHLPVELQHTVADSKQEIKALSSNLKIGNKPLTNKWLFWTMLNISGILSILNFTNIPQNQLIQEPTQLIYYNKIIRKAKCVRAIRYWFIFTCAIAFYISMLVCYGRCFITNQWQCSRNVCYAGFIASITPMVGAGIALGKYCRLRYLYISPSLSKQIPKDAIAVYIANLAVYLLLTIYYIIMISNGVLYDNGYENMYGYELPRTIVASGVIPNNNQTFAMVNPTFTICNKVLVILPGVQITLFGLLCLSQYMLTILQTHRRWVASV